MGSRKTKKFQNLLQENFQEVLDMEVSKELTWRIFKACFVTVVQFLMGLVDVEKMEDVKLPLAGIGTFRIDFRRPRKIAGRPSVLEGKTDWVPYFRFKASTRYRRLLLKKFCGVIEPIPVSRKIQARREQRRQQRK